MGTKSALDKGPKRISWAAACWSWPVMGTVKIPTLVIGHWDRPCRNIYPGEITQGYSGGGAGFHNIQRTPKGAENPDSEGPCETAGGKAGPSGWAG